MGEPIKIVQLADNLITALGLSPAEVARQYVGLRPGEKMHEILWDEVEEVIPSQHERIFSVRQRARALGEMETLLIRLEELAIFGSVDDLLAKVSELVPTYRPQERSGAGVPADAVAGPRHG